MGEFKQGKLSPWDYMWQDKQGRRFVGMVMFPSKRKREGRYLWEMKQQIVSAYNSKRYVPMTILYQDTFLDLDGRVWDVSEQNNIVTIQDLAGNYYRVRISDVLHIESDEQDELR
ncbi:hypothetical protein ACFDTO_23285 [Microbacteriaceae bacterium 4G12]